MKIIVGLGNPGKQYEMTRHNVGFRLIDRLGTDFGADFRLDRAMNCELAKVKVDSEDIVLVKPLTYMNLSGQAVQKVLHWYKCPPTAMIVVHDDVSINLGRLRFQKGGGAGGQHGVESIIECLGGNKQFDRLKLGVGPDPGGARRADYVLGIFPAAQNDILERIFGHADQALKLWIGKGIEVSANSFNGLDFSQPVT